MSLAGLETLAERPARTLSGGQAQRLAIVRALAANPALLLADEPTAHLDPQSMFAIETLLARIALTGTKVVMVSHDRGQIDRLASEVAFLHRGRCCEVSETDRFFAQAQSDEAQTYLDGTLPAVIRLALGFALGGRAGLGRRQRGADPVDHVDAEFRALCRHPATGRGGLGP